MLEVLPEGTLVNEGDVIVKLDGSALEQQLLQEKLFSTTRRRVMIQAENLWEAAKLAKTEYLEGTFKQEEQLLQAEAFVAKENSRPAIRPLQRTPGGQGLRHGMQLESDRFAVEKARKDLPAAQTKLHVIQNYTKEKMLRQFESDIRSAEASFHSEKSSYELQAKAIQEDFVGQIASARFAHQGRPGGARQQRDHRGDDEFVVEPHWCASGKSSCRLPNSAKMQVKTEISESKIAVRAPKA